MLTEEMYTIEEISRYLKIPVLVIQREIEAGKLAAKNFAGFIRISKSSLDDYVNGAGTVTTIPTSETELHLDLKPMPDFDHKWPGGIVEHFRRAQEGVVSYVGRDFRVKLGFTVRKAAGCHRSRCLVLVDHYPTVEFVKADESDEVGLVAGIIKGRNKKHVAATSSVPPEYEGMAVGIYREVVDGPGAAYGMAVICKSDDFETMVKHALIQYCYRED